MEKITDIGQIVALCQTMTNLKLTLCAVRTGCLHNVGMKNVI